MGDWIEPGLTVDLFWYSTKDFELGPWSFLLVLSVYSTKVLARFVAPDLSCGSPWDYDSSSEID